MDGGGEGGISPDSFKISFRINDNYASSRSHSSNMEMNLCQTPQAEFILIENLDNGYVLFSIIGIYITKSVSIFDRK